MNFGDIRHDLLYVRNLNNTLRNSTVVGMSNLFLKVKSENAEYSVKSVSIEHFYQLKIRYN